MMKAVHSNTFDILYIDCSLHTSMSIRWEIRETIKNFHNNNSSTRILQQASTVLSTHSIKQNRSEKLPLICDELRKHCEGSYKTLKAVCVCIGPGSFTGTRASLAFAKGICCGNPNIKLVTFTSFHIIAQAYYTYRPLLAVCDARNNHYVYQLSTQNNEYKNNTVLQNNEILDISNLHSKIQLLLDQYTTLYIAGEPAVSIYEQLHTQYTHYYTPLNKSKNSTPSLLLPHTHWENIQLIQSISTVAFLKFISKDFSSMNCTPLYGKHYIS